MNALSWVKLGVGIAIAVALYLVGLFIYNAGAASVQTEWDKDTIVKQQQYEKDLIAAVDAARQEEQSKAELAVKAAKTLMESNRATKIMANAALSNANGLWLDAQCVTPNYRIQLTTASTSRDCSTTPIQLSAESARFLIEQATQADENTNQLTAAQQLLEVDRQTISGDPHEHH